MVFWLYNRQYGDGGATSKGKISMGVFRFLQVYILRIGMVFLLTRWQIKYTGTNWGSGRLNSYIWFLFGWGASHISKTKRVKTLSTPRILWNYCKTARLGLFENSSHFTKQKKVLIFSLKEDFKIFTKYGFKENQHCYENKIQKLHVYIIILYLDVSTALRRSSSVK